jgi:hypothetical protein
MTMHPEWIKWAGHHGTVFSLNRADDLQTLLAWAGLFERNGFEPWHLTAATDQSTFAACAGPCAPWPRPNNGALPASARRITGPASGVATRASSASRA